MKYPPSRTRGLRPMKALQEGESSHTYRVRAPDPVHSWWGSLTAEQRGEVLAHVFAGRPVSPQEAPEQAAQALAAETPGNPSEAPSRPAQGQLERVALGQIPEDPRPHHLPILHALEAGATLTRMPGEPWRLIGAGLPFRTIKPATVDLLLREGVLIREDG